MATKKKLLEAAAGNAGGAGLNVEDVFSTYLYTGNGSSQVIENGINLGQSYGSGSAKFIDPYDPHPIEFDTAVSLSGDFTVEAWINRTTTNTVILGSDWTGSNDNIQLKVNSSGYLQLYSEPGPVNTVASTGAMSLGTWYHVAATRSGSTIYLWVNGASVGTGTDSNTFSFKNIGQLGNYTGGGGNEGYISDLRISNNARYTSGFTPPTSALTADANTIFLALQSDDLFTDKTGTRTLTVSNSVSSSTFGPFDAADAGEGGLVWLKNRDGAYDHHAYDTERGATKKLIQNKTNAESTDTSGITAFNSNGFTIGPHAAVNTSGNSIASWTFRKAPKFFTCVTWTGDGSGPRVINHNLGANIGFLLIKCTSNPDNWWAHHRSINFPLGYGFLDTTDSWNNTGSYLSAADDTSFTLSGVGNNISGRTYVAYLFAHNDGDGDFGPTGDQDIIKCGSYTGNGSTDGPEVDLGFEPQWIMIKRTDSTGGWRMLDVMRGITDSGSQELSAQDAAAESGAGNHRVYANGYQPLLTGAAYNASGGNYIYIAIRRGPMAVPESADEVFDVEINTTDLQSGTDLPATNMTTDLMISHWRDGNYGPFAIPRLTGGRGMYVFSTGSEFTSYFDMGFKQTQIECTGNFDTTSSPRVYWHWKRAPSFFDVVAYTGNGTAGRTVSHNLTVPPELMIIKKRSGGTNRSWPVWQSSLDINDSLYLNTTDAVNPSVNYFNGTAPTSSEVTLSSNDFVNGSTYPYIAYLFASLAGISKVGSYTGNGSTQTIDCGFSSGARFVLIKRTDSTGDWYVWDTERGIVAANDPHLSLNTTAAEVTTDDSIDPVSSGFAVNQVSATNINVSSASYIYYAVS